MKANLKIEGLSCEHCVRALDEILRNSKGVQEVRVQLPDNAAITYDEEETNLDQLKKAINESGIYQTK